MAMQFDIKTVIDQRGNLSVLEHLPFAVKRVYYLHGTEVSSMRGGHAQKTLDRIMIAVHGSFKASVRYHQWDTYTLNDPTVGLRILPKEWVELTDFSKDAVCLVLASDAYNEADSVRDFATFKRLTKARSFCDCRQGRDPCDCERSVA